MAVFYTHARRGKRIANARDVLRLTAWSGVCFYTIERVRSFRLADFPAVRDGDFNMQGRRVRIYITAAVFAFAARFAPVFAADEMEKTPPPAPPAPSAPASVAPKADDAAKSWNG